MNLKNLFANKKSETTPELFLAVEIHESLIKTAVWELSDGEPTIVGLGSYEMWDDEESLINGTDASLTQAIKGISAQPKQVIFGLPDSWLEGSKIHPSKTLLLKHLITELNLQPIGMVTITEAITHHLKKREGIPPTAVLLEIYATKVVVSVVRLGEVLFMEEVGRSGDLAKDVEEGLARMDTDQLPARFILTNGSDLENEEQQITAYPWQDRLPFVHIPKVEVLPIDFSIKAIALTGGSEAIKSVEGHEEESSSTAPEMQTEAVKEMVATTTVTTDMEEAGFSVEESNQEITPESAINEESNIVPVNDESPLYAVSDDEAVPGKPDSKSFPKLPKISLPRPKIKLPHFKFKGSPLFILGIPLVIILLLAGYFFLASAEVTVSVNPQKLNKNIDIAIATEKQANLPTLLAQKKTVSGQASDSIGTTGETTVGEKATGTVTVFNRSVAPISVKAGAIIASDTGKYNYLVVEGFSVASKSADLASGSEVFGKKEGVKIIATKIGADSNLSKGSSFSVDNLSKSVAYAMADSDLTGGTSRTVRAVSKADQDKLFSQVSDKIKTQVQDGTQAENIGMVALPLKELVFNKKTFNKAIGEESATLSLDMSGSVDLLVYNKNDLYQLVYDQLKSQVPAGTVMSADQTKVTLSTPVLGLAGVYTAGATVSATLIPSINVGSYASLLRFKPISKARQLLETIPGFDSAIVKVSPPIPVLSTFFPARNIKLDLTTR